MAAKPSRRQKAAGRLAFLLFFLVLALSAPMSIMHVLANLQRNVTELVLTNDPTNSYPNQYSLNLNWNRPPASDTLDNDYNLVDPAPGADDRTRAKFYDLRMRNATYSESYHVFQRVEHADESTDAMLYRYANAQLQSGSLYLFEVIAGHLHTYRVYDSPAFISRPAPMEKAPPPAEAIFLTDINVQAAKGSGGNMTVIWDNPTKDGMEIFTGYRIYYALGGQQATLDNKQYKEVSSKSPDLVRTSDGKLKYTFFDGNLKIGKYYAVKIEPMLNMKLAREQDSIEINKTSYSFAYRPLSHEYRYNDAYVKPALHAISEGQDYVRIYWDSIKASLQNIDSLEIYESTSETMENRTRIGLLSGESASDINYWLTPRPDALTYYQIIIYYESEINGLLESMESEIAWFDPAYNDFTPYKPTILAVSDNEEAPHIIDIAWQAFARPAYSDIEEDLSDPNYGGKFIDRNIRYDIYVTDDISNFDNPRFNDKIVASVHASSLSLRPYTQAGSKQTIPSYASSIKEYYYLDPSGAIVRNALEDNAVYYIRIVATRDPSGQVSQPAIGSHFIPPLGDLSTNPLMMTRPPLRIKAGSDGIEYISQSSVTIQWDMLYYEAFNEADLSWYAKIGVASDGSLAFGKEADKLSDPNRVLLLNDPVYLNAGGMLKIKDDLRDLGANSAAVASLPLRRMDLGGSSFEIHTVSYDKMLAAGGYEAYMDMLSGESGDIFWNSIEIEGDPLHPEYTAVADDSSGKLALAPNTAYVVFFRPYIINEGKKTAHFPSYVTATTLGVKPPLEIIPTVPALEPAGRTDMSLTVRWEYSPELQYELRHSTFASDYPDGGIAIPWEDIKLNGAVVSRDGKHFMEYTISGLFPDTSVSIWLRSTAPNLSGAVSSAWSNPISMTTLDIKAPDPPRGLTFADESHIAAYNVANGTAFEYAAENYLIAEWMMDALDKAADMEAPTRAASPAGGAADFLGRSADAAMYLVKFNNLEANRIYYLRAKTILTVTKDDSGISTSYSYTVSISRNSQFLDAVEITVPAMEALENMDPIYTKRKESGWSKSVSLFTSRTDGEYDGNATPDMHPLPIKDFEIIYDHVKSIATYRFRDDKIDQNGDHDNFVDERFISKLALGKVYTYKVDLTEEFYLPVRTRMIDVPASIISAFRERGISLAITIGSFSATLPPGSIDTSAPDFGFGSRIIIIFKESSEKPPLKSGESYLAKPQELEIVLKTPARNIKVESLSSPIEIEIAFEKSSSPYPFNANAFYSDKNALGWELVKSEKTQRKLTFSASNLGKYAAIGFKTPAVAPLPFNAHSDPEAREAMLYISSKIRIEDLNVLIPNSVISSNQLNQLISAIACGKPSVSVNQPLSAEDEKALKKSKLYVASTPAVREDGLSSLVRLREIMVGKVHRHPSLDQSKYMDLASASPEKRIELLKAEALGFINPEAKMNSSMLRADPKGYMTVGEAFKILAVILQDARSQ
jgi:hypothetical protein